MSTANPIAPSLINDNQKHRRLTLAKVFNRVRDIGAVGRGIALVEFRGIVRRLDAYATLFDSEELSRSLEMRCAAQDSTGLESDLIELHIFLEIQRGQCPDLDVFVRAIQMFAIIGSNNMDRSRGRGDLDELGQRHAERLSDLARDGQGRIRLIAFDLAEHRATDAGCRSQLLQRPDALLSHLLHTL